MDQMPHTLAMRDTGNYFTIYTNWFSDTNFLLFIVYRFILIKILFVRMPDGMTTRTVFCTGNPVVSWQNVPAACEREYITLISFQ